MRRKLSILVAIPAIACALGPVTARADDAVLLVLVDSEDSAVDASAVRAALAERLELRVVSLMDPDATSSRASLSVGVARGGHRVELCYHDTAGRRRFDEAVGSVGDAGSVAAAAAAFMQRIIDESVWTIPSEVLDPFSPHVSPSPRRGPSEVIDPWEVPWARAQPEEPGSRLGTPRSR